MCAQVIVDATARTEVPRVDPDLARALAAREGMGERPLTPQRAKGAQLATAKLAAVKAEAHGRLVRAAQAGNMALVELDQRWDRGELNRKWYEGQRARILAERADAVTQAKYDLVRELNAVVADLDHTVTNAPVHPLSEQGWRALSAAKDVAALDPDEGLAAFEALVAQHDPATARESRTYLRALAKHPAYDLAGAGTAERGGRLARIYADAHDVLETEWDVALDQVRTARERIVPQLDVLTDVVATEGRWQGAMDPRASAGVAPDGSNGLLPDLALPPIRPPTPAAPVPYMT